MHIKGQWCCSPIYERLWNPTLSHNMIESSFPKETITKSQPWNPWLYQTHREGEKTLTFYVRACVEWEMLTWLLPCLYQTTLKTEMHIDTPGSRSNLKFLTVSCLKRAAASLSHPTEECGVVCLQHTNVDDPIPLFFQSRWSLQLFRSCLTLLTLLWTLSSLSAPSTVGDSRSRHGILELVALITLCYYNSIITSTQGFPG